MLGKLFSILTRMKNDLNSDKRGQAGVIAMVVGAVVGVIGVLVYTLIYAALNTETVPAGALSMLNILPTIMAAVIVIGAVLWLGVMRR